MGKYKENAKHKIISLRISDGEKLMLEAMMRRTSRSTSSLMRDAISAYAAYCLGGMECEGK